MRYSASLQQQTPLKSLPLTLLQLPLNQHRHQCITFIARLPYMDVVLTTEPQPVGLTSRGVHHNLNRNRSPNRSRNRSRNRNRNRSRNRSPNRSRNRSHSLNLNRSLSLNLSRRLNHNRNRNNQQQNQQLHLVLRSQQVR